MTAALTQPHSKLKRGDGLFPTSPARDLYQIAELVELCFAEQLDATGRAIIREMKALARLGPLLWLLTLLDPTGAGLGLGFVWRSKGRVVGNVSLYRGGTHPDLGRGWLVANVAVHPDHRRQHIARALMDAGMDLARRKGGDWIVLQVEADNEAALNLYTGLGFAQEETLAQWETNLRYPALPDPDEDAWPIRRRFATEWAAEADLIYNRARPGAMAWTRPIERYDLYGPFNILEGQHKLRQVLPDPARQGRLLGSLWIESSSRHKARLSLFLDPALRDPHGRKALLLSALRLPNLQGRTIRLETTQGDAPIEEVLHAAGFRETRTLVIMRRMLHNNMLER